MEQSCCGPGRSDNSESALNVVSKITINFNQKFKDFIKKLKRILSVDISGLIFTDTNRLMPIQNKIREYIYENQGEIDIDGGKKINEKDHPNIFAIMICVIIDELNNYKSFQEVLDESQRFRWEVGMHASNEPNDAGYANSYAEQHFRCACNHVCQPYNMYIICNVKTGLRIAVGDECIKKTKFIESDELTELKNLSKKNPHYIAIRQAVHIKKMNDGLSKKRKRETIESVSEKYSYIGGNYGDHKEIAELHFMLINSDTNSNFKIEDFQRNVCGICDQKNIKDNIFIANIPDVKNKPQRIKALCKTCIDYLNIKYKKKGVCDDCGELHKNKSDNYCDICRKKKACTNCEKRDFLDGKGRCNICHNCKWCKKCEKEIVNKEGWLCRSCYVKAPLCESPNCNKTITNLRYKTCWSCKSENNSNTKICNFPNCEKTIDPKYTTCWSHKSVKK
jgi:hypothetical protein